MGMKFGLRLVFCVVMVLSALVYAVEKPSTSQDSCISSECHNDYAKKRYVHGPVDLGDCQSCHKEANVSLHTFKYVRQGGEMCTNCHLDQVEKKNIHDPVSKGECLECHDPHSSDGQFLLVSNNVSEVCSKCHETTRGMDYLHGPVAVGQCSICHSSHSSDYKALLTVEPDKLCFSCHEITEQELEKFEFVHEPVRGDCVGCHSPHGADNSKMLIAEAPDLCYPCHEDIKEMAENSAVKHSVVKSDGGCLKCHTPHASSIQYGLKSAPMDLCMDCHDKAVGISKNEVLKALSDEIEGMKFMHGPVGEKNCKGCHSPHGSENFRLLTKDYPPQFYSPFAVENYDLCFSCHPKDLVLNAETRNLTDFRNGRSNLHFLHVNKDPRGRTCRSCHAVHASNQEKHLRESVPYGRWELPIGFSKTETGGRCAPGCHLPKDYDRKKPVEY